MEKGVWRCLEGDWNFGCVGSGGFEKSVRSRGRAQNLAIKLGGRITWVGPACFAEIVASLSYKGNKNQLCYFMTTVPARLAGIPVLWCRNPCWKVIPSNHACQAARQMNQARNRTAGNTLLMCAASNLYIKIAAPGWPGPCNTRIKVTSADLASPI